MKTIIKVNHESTQSSDNIWNVLKTGANVHEWLPFIASCELVGEGEGAKRLCKTDQGKDVNESILKIDHENKTFIYGIDNHTMEMPTKNIIGKMAVLEVNGKTNSCWEIEYDLTVDLDADTKLELEKGFKDMMLLGLQGLDQVAKK